MKSVLRIAFYAIFGGLASASGVMTLLYSPGYEIWGVFGILAGAYGFWKAMKMNGKQTKERN